MFYDVLSQKVDFYKQTIKIYSRQLCKTIENSCFYFSETYCEIFITFVVSIIAKNSLSCYILKVIKCHCIIIIIVDVFSETLGLGSVRS